MSMLIKRKEAIFGLFDLGSYQVVLWSCSWLSTERSLSRLLLMVLIFIYLFSSSVTREINQKFFSLNLGDLVYLS